MPPTPQSPPPVKIDFGAFLLAAGLVLAAFLLAALATIFLNGGTLLHNATPAEMEAALRQAGMHAEADEIRQQQAEIEALDAEIEMLNKELAQRQSVSHR